MYLQFNRIVCYNVVVRLNIRNIRACHFPEFVIPCRIEGHLTWLPEMEQSVSDE